MVVVGYGARTMADDLFGDRLLVIDDEPGFLQIVKKVAEASRFEAVVTGDPSAFVNVARQWHPTVIMLDLKMPGTDGVQLLRSLAADNCPAHVILTSGSDAKVLDAAMQLGRERGLKMSEALSKPMRVESLQERLAGLKGMAKPLLAVDLAAALAADQLFLEYQPKLDCRLGRITGAEALVRWRHPARGIIQPNQFIALAEETGLIHGVTDWVVATAAAQAARWRADNLGLEVAVAVNFSARDLVDLDLPDRLEQHCRAAGSDPAFLTLELTETGAMREAVSMMDILTRLRLKGFRLSIDDFGTGYSSLVQLQVMPFSEIKIDLSFVTQMISNSGCRVIVEIIIDLARKLGLTSVAEGVEEEAALKLLIETGCDVAQGYYISRPIAGDLMPQFVADYRSARAKTAAEFAHSEE
jgi:EAL domain-containing protein (putative c-di-GMP-specific phosphodiesterase class I)/ActR/RegA family two-component response regulator